MAAARLQLVEIYHHQVWSTLAKFGCALSHNCRQSERPVPPSPRHPVTYPALTALPAAATARPVLIQFTATAAAASQPAALQHSDTSDQSDSVSDVSVEF